MQNSLQVVQQVTPEWLFAMATEQEALYLALKEEFPSGTKHEGKSIARRHMEDALACAQWLERQQGGSLERVGPYGGVKIRRGQVIRVARGSLIFSTQSKWPRAGKISIRAQVVKLDRLSEGCVDWSEGEPRIVQAGAHWPGEGGYWRWTDANNVSVVEC